MNTTYLHFYVVDVETDAAVAAFYDEFTAVMWQLEYQSKTGRDLNLVCA